MFWSHLNFCISLHKQLWSWLLSGGELVPWGMCLKLEMYRIFKGWRDGACEVFASEGRNRFEWDSDALVTHLPGDSPTSFLLDCTAPPLKLCCLLNSSKHSQGTSVVSVCTHLVSSYWKCLKETTECHRTSQQFNLPWSHMFPCSLQRISVSMCLVRHCHNFWTQKQYNVYGNFWMDVPLGL